MDNNLKKIEKDLRAFAKRCKDIKYTQILLFVFLLTGLLSIAAPADSVETARRDLNTSITDMKKLFKEAKQENNKLMKGSNLELIQLMEQGDHVVKSPWSSWQYGMNYFYGDWTGTYRGRGDKTPNQKYERFSSSKFATYSGGKYGMTDLNSKVIEPISPVPIDAAVKPKIPIIKTVDAAEVPVLTPPTLNISVSTVAPSNTTVPSITPPKVNIPSVSMNPVSGFTLVFPNSGELSTKHGTNENKTVNIDNATRQDYNTRNGTNIDANYISYYQIAGNGFTSQKTPVKLIMTGSKEADNISGTGTYYGGGSRFAYVDDVRRDTTKISSLKFTLENQANISLKGPAIAGIVNEETSYTDGNIVTNITNMGSINDDTESLTGSYTGNLRNSIGDNAGTPKQITANSYNKIGYKVGIAQTTEETIHHISGTSYELFNGSEAGTSTFITDFDTKLQAAIIAKPNSHFSVNTLGKNTAIDGNNAAQSGGVIHFSGDYSTGIQVASAKIPVVSGSWPAGTPTTWSDNNSRSLVRADNKADGYMQLDGAYS